MATSCPSFALNGPRLGRKRALDGQPARWTSPRGPPPRQGRCCCHHSTLVSTHSPARPVRVHPGAPRRAPLVPTLVLFRGQPQKSESSYAAHFIDENTEAQGCKVTQQTGVGLERGPTTSSAAWNSLEGTGMHRPHPRPPPRLSSLPASQSLARFPRTRPSRQPWGRQPRPPRLCGERGGHANERSRADHGSEESSSPTNSGYLFPPRGNSTCKLGKL